MQNCINLSTLGLIVSRTDAGTIRDADGTSGRISLKRGSQTPLVAQFLDQPFGTPQELGAPLELRFGAKIAGQEDGSYVVSNFDQGLGTFVYVKTGAAETTLYTVAPSWSTKKLNNLLGFDPDGFAEETEIRTVADVSGSLHRKTFVLHDNAGSVGVWIDVGGVGGAAPAAALACTRAISVICAEDDSAATVATLIAAALAADTQFAATTSDGGDLVSVVDSVIGPRTAATAGDTGFDVERWIAGSLPNTLDNVPYVDLEAEWYWDVAGVVSKSQSFTIRVYPSVNNGNEGFPSDPTPAYPAPGRVVTFPSTNPLGDLVPGGAISSADLIVANDNAGIFRRKIAPLAAGGAYTAKYCLTAQTRPGFGFVNIELPASANPTVELYDLTTLGTKLVSVTSPDPTQPYYWWGIYFYDGSHWHEFAKGFQS